MEADLLQERNEVHLLIDALPEDKLHLARGLLGILVEPLSASLAAAPFDDEDLTPEAIASIRRGELDFKQGRTTSHEEMLREFGD